ncbi:MAG: MerR family transcriptional regulator [Polyangiaceae bacterium]
MSRYRIRAVAELTGVSTATLRAWERRYGVPTPSRTASAYRLYGDDDVALVAQMRDLVESGVAPAEAARALREQSNGVMEAAAGGGDAFQLAADRIVDAASRFDIDGIRGEITRALSLGSAITIFDRTLAPALVRVGDLWHTGQITVAQEHLLSGLLLARVAQLLELVQPTDSTRSVALACFEGEDHVLGLYGTGLHFAAWGYRSVFLGPCTPPDAVARAIAALNVDVVALSATVAPETSRQRALIDAYADACRGVPWIVGGQGAVAMRRFIESRGGIVGELPFGDVRLAVDKAVRRERRPGTDTPSEGLSALGR